MVKIPAAVACLLLACCAVATAAPPTLKVPLAETAAASADTAAKAAKANRGWLFDLASEKPCVVLTGKPAADLAPGRYRLHALVGTGPHDNLIVDPVDVRLSASEASATFERAACFPKAGELADVRLDFVVERAGRPEIGVEWVVGDSLLNREKYRSFRQYGEKRSAFLTDRAAAVTQAQTLEARPDTGLSLGDAGDGLGELESAKETVDLSAATPRYRLAVTGVHVERICPVSVEAVEPDAPACPPGQRPELTVRLRNWSDKDAEIKLAVTIRSGNDRQAGLQVALPEQMVKVPAGATVEHKPPGQWSTDDMRWLGRCEVRATVPGLSPSTGEGVFVLEPPPRHRPNRPKKAFAHYMGCWPAGTGVLVYQRRTEGESLKHESTDQAWSMGGHVRNYDLVPPKKELSADQSAELEIRRAMRIGIDGFAVDAWAGDEGAKKTFDTLIRTAERLDLPFEVTICIDPSCGGDAVTDVRWLLEKYGKNPKLARRDGRPLVFGYMSTGPASAYMRRQLPGRSERQVRDAWAGPLGWHLMGQSFLDAADRIGQPVFFHACMSWFFQNMDSKLLPPSAWSSAAGVVGRYADAVGAFTDVPDEPNVAKAVIAAGAEWAGTVGMYQKENIPYEFYTPRGTEWLSGRWQAAISQDATLLQLVTWNDYGENSNIAPGWNTRYTLYDLTGWYLKWWKAGQEPKTDHDRIYLTWAKYPSDAKVWPFRAPVRRDRRIEVVTILTAPGKVRLPGRDAEYDAPAGFHREQFPLTVGALSVELLREGEVVTRLEAPEPITDRPFRQDVGLVCVSTEFERNWRADFGDEPVWHFSEYGDADGDGLPNWFEMYWFTHERGFKPAKAGGLLELEETKTVYTRWLDFATQTLIRPDADPDGDGKTNRQEYEARTDPTLPPAGAVPGDATEPGGLLDGLE